MMKIHIFFCELLISLDSGGSRFITCVTLRSFVRFVGVGVDEPKIILI